ncbi:MAG TPA: hypothetical protein VMD30_04325, partial [Tepidisphaeraceae bacterium]|nr:hypothetical protein [Tepidisphaeraceae bacterium]
SGEVRVAIADRGIGIAASLRHRYPEIRTAKQALEKVIGGGVSARSRPSNMGCGISNLCNVIVNVLRGELFIISGEGMADGAPGHAIRSRDFTAGFPGTGVFFTIPVT